VLCAIALEAKPMLNVPAPTASIRLSEGVVRVEAMFGVSARHPT
jgi:hypothetical protein